MTQPVNSNTSSAYSMKEQGHAGWKSIRMEKSKIMVNIKKTQKIMKLKKENSFKYLGAILFTDGAITDGVRIRMSMATAAMGSLKRLWRKYFISRQVQAIQVPHSFHPSGRLRDLNALNGH
ncbi:hypothetical protein DPMN_112967 [Dreissena polymorpha]|uniref:Uncharacterized protein n=1 Tax=Dreissena polymorpha TaxID=45954 RepID=A0A9D4QRE6_DREPO|nr:hypothetical protein DPMN_112967 [Dreissena polymorpha]